jgi:hypothetical protein
MYQTPDIHTPLCIKHLTFKPLYVSNTWHSNPFMYNWTPDIQTPLCIKHLTFQPLYVLTGGSIWTSIPSPDCIPWQWAERLKTQRISAPSSYAMNSCTTFIEKCFCSTIYGEMAAVGLDDKRPLVMNERCNMHTVCRYHAELHSVSLCRYLLILLNRLWSAYW